MKLSGSFSDCFANDREIKHLFIGMGSDPEHPNDGMVGVVLELDVPPEDVTDLLNNETTVLRLTSARNMHKFRNFDEATKFYSKRANDLINDGYLMMPNYSIVNIVNLETDHLQKQH